MNEIFTLKGQRVWVAGHNGMVGAALVRRLAREDCTVLTAPRAEIDLKRQEQVEAFVAREKPKVVIVAAAKVGGILANSTYPADFLYDNLMIEANVIAAAHQQGVEKLLFLGSSCIYPRLAPQPMTEEALLTGPLEPTNEWYAVAKIAGIKLCQAYRRQHGDDFISAMPTNLYGPGDNFDLTSSHVLAALIRKADDAKRAKARELILWGSGTPLREFMHVDDCADALIHMLKTYSGEGHLNVGTGEEISILELAKLVAAVVGFSGEIVLDRSKPDGTPRKLMDSSKLRALGWRPAVGLREGIAATYRWYLNSAGEPQAQGTRELMG
jgi:GDP-L-fucose synthase